MGGVFEQVPVIDHHTLRISGGTRCVLEQGQSFDGRFGVTPFFWRASLGLSVANQRRFANPELA